jgi:DNA mismatch repair ATPase MutS
VCCSLPLDTFMRAKSKLSLVKLASQWRIVASNYSSKAHSPCSRVQEYLENFREQVGVARNSSKVCYVAMNKDSHVLEVPDDVAKKVPSSFNACAGKKGVKRFMSDELQDLSARHSDALLATEAAQNSILSRITASSIGEKREMWLEVCWLAFLGVLFTTPPWRNRSILSQ